MIRRSKNNQGRMDGLKDPTDGSDQSAQTFDWNAIYIASNSSNLAIVLMEYGHAPPFQSWTPSNTYGVNLGCL